jgi:hypothetical protein
MAVDERAISDRCKIVCMEPADLVAVSYLPEDLPTG